MVAAVVVVAALVVVVAATEVVVVAATVVASAGVVDGRGAGTLAPVARTVRPDASLRPKAASTAATSRTAQMAASAFRRRVWRGTGGQRSVADGDAGATRGRLAVHGSWSAR